MRLAVAVLALLAAALLLARLPRGSDGAAALAGAAPEAPTPPPPEVTEAPPERAPAGAPEPVPDPPPAAAEVATADDGEPEPPPPEGTLEVVVLRGETPVDTGWVHVLGGGVSRVPEDPWGAPAALHRELDARGRAVFEGLEPGRLGVGVELGGGPLLHRYARIEGGAGRRVVVRVGSAVVHGVVHGDDGRPVEGARVQLDLVGAPGEKRHLVVVRTGPDGAYRVENVTAGPGWFSVDAPGPDGRMRDLVMERFTFPGSGEVRKDVGSPRGKSIWRGAVRTEGGAIVAGRSYRRSGMHLRETGSGAYLEVELDPGEPFEVALEPGTYEVAVTPPGASERVVLVDALVVGREDLDRDLVLPGARVTGALVDGAGTRHVHPGGAAVLTLESGEGDERVVHVDEGRWTVDGVGPGTWTVTTWPCTVAAPTEVHVRAGDTHVSLDVAVRE